MVVTIGLGSQAPGVRAFQRCVVFGTVVMVALLGKDSRLSTQACPALCFLSQAAGLPVGKVKPDKALLAPKVSRTHLTMFAGDSQAESGLPETWTYISISSSSSSAVAV